LYYKARFNSPLSFVQTLVSILLFESVLIHSERGVLDTTLCDKVCQLLATGQWFSPGPPVSSANKTDRHDINEILLKMVLNTITITVTMVI